MKILICGMPRSMTTWILNVLRELIAAPTPESLWIFAGDEQRFVSSNAGLALGKCHHFSPVLAQAADIVVYSYRDLRTAAVSAYRKFHSPGTREQLEGWVASERLWLPCADAVLRYEDVEKAPREGVATLRSLLQRHAGGGLTISTLPDAAILERVDASFANRAEASGDTPQPGTLILPGHRTFQPDAGELPEAERQIYDRIENYFRDWLSAHGYVGDASPVEPAQPARGAPLPAPERDRAMSDYIAALIRESASKETEIDAQGREMRRLLSELKEREDLLHRVNAEHAEQVSALQRQIYLLGKGTASAAGADADAMATLWKENVEKEQVIRDLRSALAGYRATFAVMGVFIKLLNHFVLGVKSVIRRTKSFFAPRLGVLNQHAPRELTLPPNYANGSAAAAGPKISIVTPSFRQAKFIERTIESVLAQGYPNLEYFVQDGGSDDGTREILKRHSERLTGWDSRPDNGQTQAINRGFARTSGEIMAWLNSDDILLPGALAFVAGFFTRHPEIDVVYGHRILIDEDDRQIGRWMMPPHSDAVLSWADYVPQETMFFRRRIWEKAGGRVDEDFRFAMDWDLLIRFRDAGARFARAPRFIGGFRVHSQQKTSAAISQVGFEEMDRIRKRALGRVPSNIEVRKAVLPYLLKHIATDIGWRIQTKLGFGT